MQVSEFKAWFEGFTEAMTGPPTEEQWARLKARVEEIDGTERYPVPVWTSTGGTDVPRVPFAGKRYTASDRNAQARYEAAGKAFPAMGL